MIDASAYAKEVTCVECPLGCVVSVALVDGSVASVSGNSCKRGDRFARQEAVAPKRSLSVVVSLPGSLEPLSVKTSAPIPKEAIADVVRKVKESSIVLPVMSGEVVISQIYPGVDIVATKTLPA